MALEQPESMRLADAPANRQKERPLTVEEVMLALQLPGTAEELDALEQNLTDLTSPEVIASQEDRLPESQKANTPMYALPPPRPTLSSKFRAFVGRKLNLTLADTGFETSKSGKSVLINVKDEPDVGDKVLESVTKGMADFLKLGGRP